MKRRALRHQASFTIPPQVFTDDLTPKTFRLLVWLFTQSSSGGECSPGYEAMKWAIKGCDQTINRALKSLKRKGWLYNFQKLGPTKMRFWLRIPKHLREVIPTDTPEITVFEVPCSDIVGRTRPPDVLTFQEEQGTSPTG